MCTPGSDKPVDQAPAATLRRRCAVILVGAWLLVMGGGARTACVRAVSPADDAPRGTIDPNTATWDELTVLPRIGESKALAIVAYRTAYHARHGRRAFARPADLTAVNGIGPKTVQRIAGELHFSD